MPLEHVLRDGEEEEDVHVELDPETMALIDELAGDEVENQQDLRQFSGELSKGRMKALAQQRTTARAQQRSAAVKRLQRRENTAESSSREVHLRPAELQGQSEASGPRGSRGAPSNNNKTLGRAIVHRAASTSAE